MADENEDHSEEIAAIEAQIASLESKRSILESAMVEFGYVVNDSTAASVSWIEEEELLEEEIAWMGNLKNVYKEYFDDIMYAQYLDIELSNKVSELEGYISSIDTEIYNLQWRIYELS